MYRFRMNMLWGLVCLLLSHVSHAAPDRALVSVEDFARPPENSAFDLSPSGNKIVYQTNKMGRRAFQIASVTETGLDPIHEREIDEVLNESGAFWISDSKLFGYDVKYTGRWPAREEEPHITAWVMNDDGTGYKILWEEAPAPPRKKKRRAGRKRKPSHKVSFVLTHSLPNDPDHVLVSRIEQIPEKRDDTELDVVSDIFRMHITTGEMTSVTPDHGISGARMYRWVPDQSGVIRMGYGVVGKDEEPVLLVRRDADSSWTRLHDNDLFKRGKFDPITFGADPDILYVSSSMATGRSVVYRFSIKRGRLRGKVFGHSEANAGHLFFSKDRTRIEAVTYYDDDYRIQVLEPSFQTYLDRVEAAVGSKSFTLGSSNRERTHRIIWVGDERRPGSPWLFSEATGTAFALPEVEPWIDPKQMAKVDSIWYRARDGLEIPGYLTLPVGSERGKKLPAIVMPHGGPYVRDIKVFDYWAQFLANRGYAVLQPNFRGSTGYGERFMVLGFGEWGDDMQQDVADGASWLVSEGIADPDKICIVGGSYGGYAALMGLVQDSDLFRCGIAWAPVTDLKLILEQDNAWDKDYPWFWRVTGGKSTKELREISPAFLAKKIQRPLLLMHGDADDIVFIEQSRILASAMQKRRSPSPFFYEELAGIGHSLETEQSRVRFLTEVQDFLALYNPTPSNTGQPASAPTGAEE